MGMFLWIIFWSVVAFVGFFAAVFVYGVLDVLIPGMIRAAQRKFEERMK